MGPMLRLRLYWYRTDKEVWLFALILGGVAALFCMVFWGVFAHQQARQNRTIETHVQNLDCLARNIYYEARGEPLAGQYAVAEVTMNRKASPFYPKTVCEVVYQREAFSWTDSKELETPAGPAWKQIGRAHV